jgi:hypothetical protein
LVLYPMGLVLMERSSTSMLRVAFGGISANIVLDLERGVCIHIASKYTDLAVKHG